ncbi:MAG: hypothetical protein AAF730_03280 [Bacteroidota bacterium]
MMYKGRALDLGQTAQRHHKKWKLLAPLGLVLIGLGVSLVGEAVLLKGGEAGFWSWFGMGTFSLVVLNAGICVFGDAVKHRAHYERLSGR